MPPPPRMVELTSSTPPIRVRAWMGRTEPALSGGVGGWEEIERPRRVSITNWKGRSPWRLSMPMMIDGWKDTASVEAICSDLERMGLPVGARLRPPIVRVSGWGIPRSDLDWVIENIEWGASIRGAAGFRQRQEVTVGLLQHVQEDRINYKQNAAATVRENAASVSSKPTSSGKLYVVREGDTLERIASEQMGSYKQWRDISDANALRDPEAIKVGQRIRLP